MKLKNKTLYLLLCSLPFGCSPNPQAQTPVAEPPAAVHGAVQEIQLATLKLTPEAETRTGIELYVVEQVTLPTYRTLSGEITLPPGHTRTITVPVAGTLVAAGVSLEPGSPIQRGQALYRLVPLDRESRGRDVRADAQKELGSAQARLEAAQARFRRAEQLLRDGAGSQKNVEEAQLELSQAEVAEKAAIDQLSYLSETPFDTPEGLLIESPDQGILMKSYATGGQIVPAGTAVAEIAKLSPLWIRVPAYVGEAAELQGSRSVVVHGIGQPPDSGGRNVRRVNGVPSANAAAATADLYYEVDNSSLRFRPGEKVAVSFGAQVQETLAVPWSAVIHDIDGGAWVYENTAPQTYSRRRVEVMFVREGMAALRRGPSAGTKVVKTGSAELFGTEFGVAH